MVWESLGFGLVLEGKLNISALSEGFFLIKMLEKDFLNNKITGGETITNASPGR